ncbi:MAG: STAS domain-containing protein, partial [Chlorobiaceae bacterium]|nr:STAS domain-containing protein [Chlorobiaceae bacterium]
FSQVKAIDSSGISSMLLAHQLANRSEGLAIFVSLCQQIKDLLKLSNLDKQLYIFASINEVMTLIEPAMKSKRGSRAKAQPQSYEVIDELCDDLDIIPVPDLQDETLEEELVDTDETDHADEAEEETGQTQVATEKEPAARKRGRPKKTEEPENGE